MKPILLAALPLLGLLAAACGDDPDPVPDAPADTGGSDADAPAGDPFGDVTWVLASATVDGDDLALLDDHPVTLERSDDGIAGRSACNSYGGSATVDGDSISIGDTFSTQMACFPDEVMQLEADYLAALTRVDTIDTDGASLTLSGDGVTLVFEPEPVPEDADLVGTDWMLETLITGDAASSTVAGSEAPLTLGDDGSVAGSTGCNRFNGTVEIGDDTLVFGPLATTRMMCEPALADQEMSVLAVLDAEPSYEIDGDTLTLTTDEGTALVYRAG